VVTVRDGSKGPVLYIWKNGKPCSVELNRRETLVVINQLAEKLFNSLTDKDLNDS
jgi:hypothetical protein